jgi:hypothetical protein
MEVNEGAGLDVGEQGLLLKEQGQARSLAEVGGSGARAVELLGLGEELSGEGRAVSWRGAGHGWCL